jgi:DNA polymerase family A
MKLEIAGKKIVFRPWSARRGQVFEKTYSFDCETTLVDEQHPWIAPAYVIGAGCDGQQGWFVLREDLVAFLEAHALPPVVMHNAPFDLSVIDVAAPQLRICDLVDHDRTWDTQLLHRLYKLACEGHTASGKGQSSLERCVADHLGIELPKDVADSRGNLVRLSYSRWLNRAFSQVEPIYLDYLARDAFCTYKIYRRLRRRIKECLESSDKSWGYVSKSWLDEQSRRWGPLTHHIQLKAAVVLKAISAAGLTVDLRRRSELVLQVEALAEEKRAVLHSAGYLPGQKGCGKALQAILRRLQRDHPGHDFRRTPTGQFAASEEALAPLAEVEPFVEAMLAFKAIEKLRSSFLGKMGKRVLHPNFDVLKTTGRTSSFGDLNAQNLPKDDRIRSLFVPPDDHVFINADYAAIEMCTLAQ